jgi:hypothetical protein
MLRLGVRMKYHKTEREERNGEINTALASHQPM